MDLVSSVTSSLGIDAGSAQGAIGSVLKLIKQQAPADTFAEVEAKAPETSQWMAAADNAPAADAGGLGGLLGAAGGILGGLGGSLGGLGDLAGLAGSLSKFGLDANSAGKLVPLVLQFLQSKAGAGLVQQLLAHVPALANLAKAAGGGAAPAGDSPLGGLGGLFK